MQILLIKCVKLKVSKDWSVYKFRIYLSLDYVFQNNQTIFIFKRKKGTASHKNSEATL